MLRRAEPISTSIGRTDEPAPADDPAAAPEAAPAAAPAFAERRRGMDRRQDDRRGMDRLRAEALRNVISMVEDRNFGGLKNRIQIGRGRGRGIPKSRLLLLAVALGAGGLAAYLTIQQPAAPAPAAVAQPEPVQAPTTQVLVAGAAIDAGQRLAPASVHWAAWPDAELQSTYITQAADPEAVAETSGQVARYAIFPGEPIRRDKLVAASAGFLSAVLDPGMRAVSVQIQAASASGGFISPDDHVDVVLTRNTGTNQDTRTILNDVRVLAINDRVGESASANDQSGASSDGTATTSFTNQAIATLALDPNEAEIAINATGMGTLSLMLRAASDVAGGPTDEATTNAAIRLSSPFWTTAGGSGAR